MNCVTPSTAAAGPKDVGDPPLRNEAEEAGHGGTNRPSHQLPQARDSASGTHSRRKNGSVPHSRSLNLAMDRVRSWQQRGPRGPELSPPSHTIWSRVSHAPAGSHAFLPRFLPYLGAFPPVGCQPWALLHHMLFSAVF